MDCRCNVFKSTICSVDCVISGRRCKIQDDTARLKWSRRRVLRFDGSDGVRYDNPVHWSMVQSVSFGI